MTTSMLCCKGDACVVPASVGTPCKLQRCLGAALYKELHDAVEVPDADQTDRQKLILGKGQPAVQARAQSSFCRHADGGARYFHQQCMETGVGKRSETLARVTNVTRPSQTAKEPDCTHTREVVDIRHLLCEDCLCDVHPGEEQPRFVYSCLLSGAANTISLLPAFGCSVQVSCTLQTLAASECGLLTGELCILYR